MQAGHSGGGDPAPPAAGSFGLLFSLSLIWHRLIAAPVIASGVALLCDFGRDAEVAVYSTVAQVAPVIALASVIELVALVPRVDEDIAMEEPIDEEHGDTLLRLASDALVLEVVGYFILCEAAALVAIATDTSTTFLLLTMLIAWRNRRLR